MLNFVPVPALPRFQRGGALRAQPAIVCSQVAPEQPAAGLDAATARKPPRHQRFPFLGHIGELLLDAEVSVRNAQKYGALYVSRMYGRDCYHVTSARSVKRVFRELDAFQTQGSIARPVLDLFGEEVVFAVDGETHRWKRAALMPAMAPSLMPLYWTPISAICEEFCRGFEEDTRQGKWCSAEESFRSLAFRVILTLTLGGELGVSVREMQRLFERLNSGMVAPRLPFGLGPWGAAVAAKERLRKIIGGVVEKKMATEGDQLAELRSAGSDEKGVRRVAVRMLKDGKLDAISIILAQLDPDADDFLDLAVEAIKILWFAGSETSSAAMRTMMFELGRRPDLKKELSAEQDRLQEKFGDLSYEQLDKMVLLDGFMNEVLRLRSPSGGLVRIAIRDAELEGYKIPKGSFVKVETRAAMLDPAAYPDPFRFDPYRYIDERGNKRDVNLFSFGGGVHVCVGATVARLELKTIYANLLRNYDLTIKENLPDKFTALPIVQPISTVPFQARKRSRVR